ncbi:MAG: translocation/assembly module TamB, partial [Bacteroidales bacterium]|nr:translocation/assembly module TamB [Bacteroidales bacterium]
SFDGRSICNDPNLSFLFQGLVNFSRNSKNAVYKFYANLGYADLNALNIDSRGTSKLSLQINSNFMRVQSGDMIGNIDVAGMSFEDDLGRHDVGDISIASHSNDEVNRINLRSKFLDGSFRGSKPFTQLIKDLQEATVDKELPALTGKKAEKRSYDDYSVTFNFHDSRDILSLVKPGLYIADSTTVKFNMARSGEVNAQIKSRRIALGAKYLKDLDLQLDNNDGSLNGTMRSGEMSISSLDFKNNAFILYADNNRIGVGYSYDNETDLENKGEIFLTGQLERSPKDSLILSAQTLPSYVYYDGNPWNIRPAGFRMQGKDIEINNLVAECYDQHIHVNGGISSSKADTLQLSLEKFNINLLNTILGEDYGIGGYATGKALLTSPTSTDMGILLNMACDSTYFGGERVGKLNLASAWNDETNKFNIIARNDLDGRRTLDLSGDFFPKDKTLDANLLLDGLNAGYAYPFLSSLFSEMKGTVHGALHVYGPISRPELESQNAGFDQVEITLDYTKCKYVATGPIHVDSYGLHFDNVNIKDRSNGAGVLSGSVTYDHLWNLGVDTHIHAERLECLDLDEKDNEDFYGNIFATGQVDITGPLSAILLEANASTSKAGNFHIPMGSSASANNSDLLVFKEPEKYIEIDPYELMMNRMKQKQKSENDLWSKLRVQATPDVEAFIEVDKETGNVLNGRGSGTILVEVRPSKDIFSLNGDYNISSGNYHFNAMNLAQRDFAIQDGSSVRFNGDVMDSELDINAIYSTKTSLANLLTDSTSVSSRRTVECGIAITDKLNNPQIAFSINVPDLDPTTKSMVESALNTDDKIQKQFIYLLIANSFLPDEQSGIANNNSNMLYSNVAQMMANQLNNIMEKLDIPLDLGLNYQSDDKGQNLFDVAVSTQLFNNRVVVNGTIGSKQYSTSGRNDEMVGDLDIEVKLDKTGQLRFNLFSHSADDYTNYLDNTQRNGVGVTYQKEFNTFRDVLRNIFTSKKKRERRALEELERQQNEDRVTIEIEKAEEK